MFITFFVILAFEKKQVFFLFMGVREDHDGKRKRNQPFFPYPGDAAGVDMRPGIHACGVCRMGGHRESG